MLLQDWHLTGWKDHTQHVLWYYSHPVKEVHSASARLCTAPILQTMDSVQHNVDTKTSQIKPEWFLLCPLQFIIYNYSNIKFRPHTPVEDAAGNITRINNQSIMCTSVITPCMLHVDVITPDYITLSQPKSQPQYQILHSKVKLSLHWDILRCRHSFMHSKYQLQMEMIGQMHVPAAASVGEEHMVATGWAPQLVQTVVGCRNISASWVDKAAVIQCIA
jgi:hypothetical protein